MSQNKGQSKDTRQVIGQNVITYKEGSVVWFGVDLAESGPQTEGSKQVDKRTGQAKAPNELVGSTRSYTPIYDGRILLHYIRPMTVQAVREARALREIANEDGAENDPDALAAIEVLKSKGLM